MPTSAFVDHSSVAERYSRRLLTARSQVRFLPLELTIGGVVKDTKGIGERTEQTKGVVWARDYELR